MKGNPKRIGGFTLIELLVVISIIATLIGLLLPALGSAKKVAWQAVAGSNLRNVAQGVMIYENEHKSYPISYVYPVSPQSSRWIKESQQETNPVPANGYVHWSWSLFEGGGVNADAFTNPATPGGGAPRANPGPMREDWEPNQVNDLGQSFPSTNPTDRQVARCGFAMNAAIIPRNKFNVSTPRKNQLVKASDIGDAQKVILGTEYQYYQDWTSLADPMNGAIKSHRPITPFIGGSSGTQVYLEPNSGNIARFAYPPASAILPKSQLGANLIEDGNSILNVVNRGHPRGMANFVYIDGHVEATTLLKTIEHREWGDRFWSLSGDNRVNMEANAF